MPDPISEQLAANVVTTLKTIKKTAGYTGDLDVIRATTSKIDIDPADLKTVLWCDDPKPTAAPWGQQGWAQVFEVAVYIRESEKSGVAIDRRISLAVADVVRALMVDRRRAGLCFVDNKVAEVLSTDGIEKGLASVRVYLLCEYRTLVGDPTSLAPAATNELLFQGGAVLLLAPYVTDRTLGPWHRFADLRIVPLLEPMVDQVRGDREGLTRAVDEPFVGHIFKYEIDAGWLNPQLLAWRLGGGDVQAYSQAATPLIAVPHPVAALDAVLPLRDVSGNPMFPVASVQAVTNQAASITYIAGTDYIADADALREGLIKIPTGSAIVPGTAVLISFTPVAVTAHPAFDVGVACRFRVRARVTWQAADGQMMVHPDFDGSLVAHSVTNDDGEPEQTKYYLTVLDDGSSRPAGRFLIPTAGNVPAAGF